MIETRSLRLLQQGRTHLRTSFEVFHVELVIEFFSSQREISVEINFSTLDWLSHV